MLWKEKNCTYWPYGTFYIIHTTYDKYQTIPCHQYYYYYNYDRHKKQLHQWKKRKIQRVLSSTEKQCSNNLLLSIKKRKQNQETDNKKLKFSHHMLLSKSWFIVLHNICTIPFLMYVAFVTIIFKQSTCNFEIKARRCKLRLNNSTLGAE